MNSETRLGCLQLPASPAIKGENEPQQRVASAGSAGAASRNARLDDSRALTQPDLVSNQTMRSCPLSPCAKNHKVYCKGSGGRSEVSVMWL